ncbi:MAG: hypothetical protein ACREMK_07735 [Gemmatimonadota bacterium]
MRRQLNTIVAITALCNLDNVNAKAQPPCNEVMVEHRMIEGQESNDNWYPFTDAELLAAYRLVLPEIEAGNLVSARYKNKARPPIPRNTEGEELGETISGINLTDDTLDLLASLSPALKERVRHFREDPDDAMQQWRERNH